MHESLLWKSEGKQGVKEKEGKEGLAEGKSHRISRRIGRKVNLRAKIRIIKPCLPGMSAMIAIHWS